MYYSYWHFFGREEVVKVELKYDHQRGNTFIFLEYDEIMAVFFVIESVAMRMRGEGFSIPDIEEKIMKHVGEYASNPTPLLIGFDFYQLDFALNIVRDIMEHERARGRDISSLEGFIEYVQHTGTPAGVSLS